MATTFTTAKMEVDAAELASLLTEMYVAKGMSEHQFPLTAPVYLASSCEDTGEAISCRQLQQVVVGQCAGNDTCQRLT